MWRKIKPTIDFILAYFLLMLLMLPIFIVALLIKLFLGSPVFFSQPRVGYQNKIFILYKFRTMSDACDHEGNLLSDEKRLGAFGRFLRALSLDELPQLWNVLKGDMSFIGPRPLLIEYLPLYNGEQKKRHDVKPGITGWAQINGRNALSWQQKFQLDCWYVKHQTFRLDAKIFGLTFRKVCKREGISQHGQATMEKFNGTN